MIPDRRSPVTSTGRSRRRSVKHLATIAAAAMFAAGCATAPPHATASDPTTTTSTAPTTPTTAPTTAQSAPVDLTGEPGPDDMYVAPGASGVGTIDNPADLGATLVREDIVPGTTVWLRSGVYTGHFVSNLEGTSAHPVVVAPYPGEHAVIDGNAATGPNTLIIYGDWSVFTGLEFTNSDTTRTLPTSGSNGRPTLIDMHGRGTKLVNNLIHSGGGCIGAWKGSVDSEISGNVILHCGWNAPDRAHGHGIYVQNNDTGRKMIEGNVIADTYGRGIQVYGSVSIHKVDFLGNVIAGGTSLAHERKSPVLIGGGGPIHDVNFVENNIYTNDVEALTLGYGTPTNTDIVVDDNRISAHGYKGVGIWVRYWHDAVGRGNVLMTDRLQIRVDNHASLAEWEDNTYVGNEKFEDYGAKSFAQWQTLFGRDLNGSVVAAHDEVLVRPNRYDGSRGLITVWNQSGLSSVSVDLSAVLDPGDRYEIRNVQDYFGDAVAEGTFSGSTVSLDMTNRNAVGPAGGTTPSAFGSDFGSFVLLPA